MGADLNALLASAQKQAAAKEELNKAKAKLRSPKTRDAERDNLADIVRGMESAQDYQASALVFREVGYLCSGCGCAAKAGGQLLVREHHRRTAGTVRYIRATAPYPNLKFVRELVEVPVEVCGECVERKLKGE